MTIIKSGCLSQEVLEHPEQKFWVLGNFIPEQDPFHNEQFEIKWGMHKAGETHQGLKSEVSCKTLTILLRGQFRIKFLESAEEKVLAQEGDYVFYDAQTEPHEWQTAEDSLLITIRWPSKRV